MIIILCCKEGKKVVILKKNRGLMLVDFIISFFRDTIDGWVYYVILVVNTILIFAIIGYLGEKKNAELLKFGMNTSTPTYNNGTVDLSVSSSNAISSSSVIPQLSRTMANNVNPNAIPNVNNATVNNTMPSPNNTVGSPSIGNSIPTINNVNVGVPNTPLQPINNSIPTINNGSSVVNSADVNVSSQVAMPTPTVSLTPEINQPQGVDSTKEQAPGILVINSNTSNQDIK